VALHDPLAVAVALDPSLVTTVETEVVIETRGQYTLGQTVADLRGRKYAPREVSPTRVCIDVDVSRARKKFFSALGLPTPGDA